MNQFLGIGTIGLLLVSVALSVWRILNLNQNMECRRFPRCSKNQAAFVLPYDYAGVAGANKPTREIEEMRCNNLMEVNVNSMSCSFVLILGNVDSWWSVIARFCYLWLSFR